MQAQASLHKTWLALLLLAGSHTLLGWYLNAHHLLWLVGLFLTLMTMTLTRKKNPGVELFPWLAQQQILTLLGGSLLLSLAIALAFIQPMLLTVSLLPLITLMYALFEMRTAEFGQAEILIWSVIMTGLGLGLGEAIDLFITPSMRL